jgi:RNA polymerase primary sigma factor
MWKIKQTQTDYEEEFGCQPSREELADLLGVSLETLNSVMRCAATPTSLDKPLRYKSAEIGRTLADIVPDKNYKMPDEALDEQKIMMLVRKSLSSLSPREEKIMRMRFGISESGNDHINFPISQEEKQELKDN